MTMSVFEDHLYVGTAMQMGMISKAVKKGTVLLKGFDLIRIDQDDF